MKTCTKCGESKAVAEFHKHSRGSGGFASSCKSCTSIAQSTHRAANRGRYSAADAAYRAANPEKTRAINAKSNAKYCAANREKVNAANAAYRAAHPDKEKARNAKYHATNPSRYSEWYAANTEKSKARAAMWRAANPETLRIHRHNRRARERANGGKLSPGLADRLFKLQRGKCACCHVSIADGNHLDHVIPLALDGPNEDWNMQLLCGPCNQSKGAKHPVDFMQLRGFLL